MIVSIPELYKSLKDHFMGVNHFMEFFFNSEDCNLYVMSKAIGDQEMINELGGVDESWQFNVPNKVTEPTEIIFKPNEYRVSKRQVYQTWLSYKSAFYKFFLSYLNNDTECFNKIWFYYLSKTTSYGNPEELPEYKDHIFFEELYFKSDELYSVIFEKDDFIINASIPDKSYAEIVYELGPGLIIVENFNETQRGLIKHLVENYHEKNVDSISLDFLSQQNIHISEANFRRDSVFKNKYFRHLIKQSNGMKIKPRLKIT